MALTFEQRSKAGKIGGSITGRKNVDSGRWKECQLKGTESSYKYKYACLITGVVKYAPHLSRYQRKLGIDTRMRLRLVPQLFKEVKIA